MKKSLIICVALALWMGLCLKVQPTDAAGAAELKALAYFSKGNASLKGYEMYLNKLNEAAKGRLNVKLVGGPEAVPIDAQTEAIRSGVVDVYSAGTGRFEALVPECYTLELSEVTAGEERKNGYYDFLNGLFMKSGLVYLGRAMTHSPFHLWTNVKVEKLSDLSGLKFRGTAFYHSAMKPFGIVPVAMPIGDIYEAMDRGLIDGWAASSNTALGRKLYEVTKYAIDHPFWGAGNTIIVANLNSWNRLPKDLQDLMVDTIAEMEPEIGALYEKAYEENIKKLKGLGVEFIRFSEADAKQFDKAVSAMKWDGLSKKSPENVAKIRKMITK